MSVLAVVVIAFWFSGCAIDSVRLPLAPAQEELPLTRAMITIPTRSGITQRLLIVEAQGPSRGALILFPGGAARNIFARTHSGSA